MLSAERHFEVFRSLREISRLANIYLPAADSIEPGTGTPQVFADQRQTIHELKPGDGFTTMTGFVGVVAPIEWTIVEKTPHRELLANRRGRYQVVSKGLLGATATIVINIYERESAVMADLFVLIDELILTGDLQHSIETAVEHQIDVIIATARKRFTILRDMREVQG